MAYHNDKQTVIIGKKIEKNTILEKKADSEGLDFVDNVNDCDLVFRF